MAKSSLLMKKKPLVVGVELATLIGLNEAIVLQQIEYWVNIKEESDDKELKTKDQNYVDGHYWTYNTVDEWTNQFPFWSYDTVKRTLKRLREKNLVYAEPLDDWGANRTLWYRPNHEELIRLEKELPKIKNELKNKNEKRIEDRKKSSVNSRYSNQNTLETSDTNISANCTNGIGQNAPLEGGKMHHTITKTSTKISTKISNLSNTSSKGEKSPLVNFFEENICELRKTTLPKFEAYVEKYDSRFIQAIIEYGALTNGHSYNWFASVIEKYIAKDMLTAEDVEQDIENWHSKNKESKNRALKQKEEKRKASEEAHKRDIAGYDALDSLVDKQPEVIYNTTNGESVNYIKDMLKANMSEASFNAFINPLNFIRVDGIIIIECATLLSMETIEKRYYEMIFSTLRENGILDRLAVKVKK